MGRVSASDSSGERWLTVSEAAARLGVSRSTLYRWAKEGRLPMYRFGQRVVRIRARDLERLGGLHGGSKRSEDERAAEAVAAAPEPCETTATESYLSTPVTLSSLLSENVRKMYEQLQPTAILAAVRQDSGAGGSGLAGHGAIGVPATWLWAGISGSDVVQWPYVAAFLQRVRGASAAAAGLLRAIDASKLFVVRTGGEDELRRREEAPGHIFAATARSESASCLVAVADVGPPMSAEEVDRLLHMWASLLCQGASYVGRHLEYERLAFEDPLTGIANRRAFEARLRDELSRVKRYKRPFSLLILDLDNFKEVNDRYGHLAGDEMLAQVASWLKANVRDSDMVARVGGDEFAVICPETDAAEAAELAARIARGITAVRSPDGQPLICTIGGVEVGPAADDVLEVYHVADMAMYEARRLGARICVVDKSGELKMVNGDAGAQSSNA